MLFDVLSFECLIDDIIYKNIDENKDVTSQLLSLSREIHEAVENSFFDYCYDNNIEDYEPQF